MQGFKSWCRRRLRNFTTGIKIKGRYRLANTWGAFLAPTPSVELINIDGFYVEIDHALEFNRYIYYNLYEEHLIALLKKVLRKGDIFFDPGTNIGYITAIASSLAGETGKVFAFEPSKRCYEILLKSNKHFKKNIRLYHAALSDKTGKALFNDTPRALSKGYACLDEVDRPDDSIPYEINTWALDDFCLKNSVDHIRFLKLDIEGSELLALKGANNLLSAGKIDYVMVETEINEGTRERNNQLINYMLNLNYTPHRMSLGGKLAKHIPDLNGTHTEDIIWLKDIV